MGTVPSKVDTTTSEISADKIPSHIAIIMDGNGRWARERGLPRLAGHKAGTDNIKRIIEAAVEYNVGMLTLYAFSTENWRRPEDEVRGLMTILGQVIDREAMNLHRNGVQLRHVGSLQGIERRLSERILYALDLTRENERIIVNVAFNYGGRAEIVEAARRMLEDRIAPEDVTEDLLSSYLYTAGAPDPDLIIRTGGDMRLSNFLIWQAAYAEYWSTSVYWPDFGKKDLQQAIAEYAGRQRRFGALA